MEEIKLRNVAAAIIIETRNLCKENKLTLLSITEKMQQNESITAKSEVMTIDSLQLDEEDRHFLAKFYEEGKAEGVFNHYRKVVKVLCHSYNNLTNPISGDTINT